MYQFRRNSCVKDSPHLIILVLFQFRTYSALRKEHDTQIVHIAMEAGLHISPEQWSMILYGDDERKSHMQSIIDKVFTFILCVLFI